MRVICRRYFDLNGLPAERSSALTIGRTYIVLEVFVSRGELSYRIESDSGSYGIHRARAFEVVSGFLPPAWQFFVERDGTPALMPPEWHVGGFWEDFYGGGPAAIADFQRRKSEIVQSEPPL